MDTRTGDTPDYIESSLSTAAGEKKSKDFETIYEEVGPSTGEAEYGTSKPKRITFKVQRVKSV
jgi:hypothetical protein